MTEEEIDPKLVIDALREPLEAALAETDKGEPVKNEKMSWRIFVNVVVYCFIYGSKSGRCLITHLAHAAAALGLPAGLKKSTFFDGFRRFSPDKARQLFYAILSRLSFFPVPEMAALGILCAVDGSHWPAMRSMVWAMVGVNKPTVLLHLAFGLNQMIPVAMLVTESNSSERSALRKMLQVGVTYVADRGYFAYYLLKEIADSNAFFVIRAPCNVTYEILECLPLYIPKGINWLYNVQDVKVLCDKKETNKTWRVVRFIICNSQFILFTNRMDLSTWQIIMVYAYRWQIELLFLFLKRTLNGIHLLSHSHKGLQIQFYLMMVAALLLLHFKQRNETANQTKVPEAQPVLVPLPADEAPQDQAKAQPEAELVPHEAPQDQATAQPEAEPVPPASQNTPEAQQESPKTDREPASGEAMASNPEAESPTQEQKTPEKAATGSKQGEKSESEPSNKPATPASKTKPENPDKNAGKSKPSATPAARQGTIEDPKTGEWYRELGQKLATFWRISIHWLEVLRANLAKPWRPATFADVPGYCKPPKQKPGK